MSQIFSSGRGIQPLINEAARILEAYIVVIDSSYQMLSMSEPPETDDAANLEEQRRIGALTEKTLYRLRRDNVFDLIRRKADRMYYSFEPDAQLWWVNMLVYVYGIEVAEIGIMEKGRKFNEYDFELMKHLRHLVSLELQRGQYFGESFGFAHSILVAELLNQSASPNLLRYRTGLLGWKGSPFYSILTVFPKMHAGHVPHRFQHQAQILAVQFSHQLPGAYWRIGERDLVFLIPRKDRNVLDILQNQRLPQLLISNNMRGILSNPVDDIINIHKAYQQTTVLYELREYLTYIDNPS